MLLADPPCGEACLSRSDQLAFRSGTEAVENWMDGLGTLKQEDSRQLVLARIASLSGDAVVALRSVQKATMDSGLRRFYGRLISKISELEDLAIVGRSLYAAQEQNKLDLDEHLAGSLASEDARRLAAPIRSASDLQARIRDFTLIFGEKWNAWDVKEISAEKDLFRAEGIRLSTVVSVPPAVILKTGSS
jgi:hypothetical protein